MWKAVQDVRSTGVQSALCSLRSDLGMHAVGRSGRVKKIKWQPIRCVTSPLAIYVRVLCP